MENIVVSVGAKDFSPLLVGVDPCVNPVFVRIEMINESVVA